MPRSSPTSRHGGWRTPSGATESEDFNLAGSPPTLRSGVSPACLPTGPLTMTTFLLPEAPITSLEAYLATEGGGLGLGGRRRSARRRRSSRSSAPGCTAEAAAASRPGASGRRSPGTGHARYVVSNGAEGEPGTFKDRALHAAQPVPVVEGRGHRRVRGRGARRSSRSRRASTGDRRASRARSQEMQTAGIAGDCPITIVAGPDEYLFGEEKALLEVIEGTTRCPAAPALRARAVRDRAQSVGQARRRRATTAPVEPDAREQRRDAVATSRTILARGAEWFRSMGTAESPGTVVCTVVGDVVTPDVAEVELGHAARRGDRRGRRRRRRRAAR